VGRGLHRVAWAWVKAVWRVFGGGSGLAQVIWFINCSKYKFAGIDVQDPTVRGGGTRERSLTRGGLENVNAPPFGMRSST
jgi:hypothetical protein